VNFDVGSRSPLGKTVDIVLCASYNVSYRENVFRIKKKSQKPIHVQLEEQIHLAIHTGQLPPGGRLPTVRALAVELQVNANTVARVYRDLQDKGYLVLERGVGTFVASEQPESPLARTDLRKVRSKTKNLVSLCQKIGLSLGELNQLTEELWKELAHE
jgi:GntR family transcriptional regulator